MGKVVDGANDAFQKNGIGNQMLRKAGEIGHGFGDAYDIAGNVALGAGTALDLVAPEFGIPLQALGGAMKVASPVVHKIGSVAEKTADTIEKPKKDLNPAKDINNIFF